MTTFTINTSDDKVYSIRESTEEDKKHLKPYRYSQLNETATCPTLAALGYGFVKDIYEDKRDEDAPRNVAIDAGSACHRVFAAVRLWGMRDHPASGVEGCRLFGDQDFSRMTAAAQKMSAEGELTQRRAFCLEALYTSGFYDDPYDKNRTMANLEQTCIAYIDRWEYDRKVWMDKSRVGIECKFDLTIECSDGWAIRFLGTLDGLHRAIDGDRLVVHENKTGRYMNDAWARGFIMSHQVTGYCVAATVFTGQPVNEAIVFGSQIPVQSARPVRVEPVMRDPQHFEQWMRWVRWCVETFNSAVDDPINAPKFTHSCGRFFGECVHIPFCAGDKDMKEQILNNLKGDKT